MKDVVNFTPTYNESGSEFAPSFDTSADMEMQFSTDDESFEPEYQEVVRSGKEEVSDERIGQMIEEYFKKNPIETTSNYPELDNKPKINGVELNGNKTAENLKLQPKGDYALKEEIPSDYVKPDALKEYALKNEIPEIPKNVSAFNNDAGYAKKTEIPNVPAWAMAEKKPTYTASEVGADVVAEQAKNEANSYTDTGISNHNVSADAHNDLRIKLNEINERLNHFLDIDDLTKDQASEFLALIEDNRELIEQITTNKINVTAIVDNLTTNLSNKVLSASMGVELKRLIDAIVIPSKVSAFENDAGYLTEHQSLEDYAKKTDVPTVPTKVSAFENDKGYLTEHQSLEGYATEQRVAEILKTYFPYSIGFNQGKLYASATSASYTAKTITDNSVTFQYRGGSGVEELIFPITGLFPGRTYTLSFDETYNGTYIQDTYRYGCGIMQKSVYDATTFPTNLAKPSWVVWHTGSTGTQKGTITFTAESDTVYWVWSLGRLSDGKNVDITINGRVY